MGLNVSKLGMVGDLEAFFGFFFSSAFGRHMIWLIARTLYPTEDQTKQRYNNGFTSMNDQPQNNDKNNKTMITCGTCYHFFYFS